MNGISVWIAGVSEKFDHPLSFLRRLMNIPQCMVNNVQAEFAQPSIQARAWKQAFDLKLKVIFFEGSFLVPLSCLLDPPVRN